MPSPRDTLELQERDLTILEGLFESRVMTVQHIVRLFFAGRKDAAYKRLQQLKASGYVTERPRRIGEPAILYMTRKAFDVLTEQHRLDKYPQIGWAALEKRVRVSPLTLQHELQVMDFKVALSTALRQIPEYHLAEFSTWPTLYQFTAREPGTTYARELTVRPDGYLRIIEEKDGARFESAFYCEIDRSTETQDTLAMKAACYVDFYRSGGYAEWRGGQRTAYKDYPFCVLFILKNAERRNNTAERLLRLNPPIREQVWLSTFDEFLHDPLGAIWVQPRRYLEAVRGTAFDPYQPPAAGHYRRQSERERLVEEHVHKRMLLES